MFARPLERSERDKHDRGHIGILDHLHRRLDERVARAYGWPADASQSEIVAGLTHLNRRRVDEESHGRVRFVRPTYQTDKVKIIEPQPIQTEAVLIPPARRPALPDEPGPLASALLSSLRRAGVPMRPEHLAAAFEGGGRRKTRTIQHTLAVLAVSGAVQQSDMGWFAPRRS